LDYPAMDVQTTTSVTGNGRRKSKASNLLDAPWRRNAALLLLLIAMLAAVGIPLWSAYLGPVTVSVAPVQSNVREEVFGLGTIGARVQSKVSFKVAGVLVALRADQGDRVKAGQVLAQLDARDVERQLAVARADVGQARANIDKAKADVVSAAATLVNAKATSERRAFLASQGFVTVEETQAANAATRVAEANLGAAHSGVEVAEAALRSAQEKEAFEQATLANYTLYAPYDAWIVSRNLELGSAPNPGESVFTRVDAHTVWVLSYVDERLAGSLSIGQRVRIVLRSNPAEPFIGHVERIEVQSDSVNEERLVDVAFDQIPDNIHLDEQAEVLITTDVLPRAILVPPTAVTDLRDRHGTVWTVENGRLARRAARRPIVDGLPVDAVVVAALVPGLRVGRAARIAKILVP
jgi:HlyD family secretion protein